MEFKVRPYHPTDCCALNRICIQTADYGDDPSAHYTDPEVIAHMYSGPYAAFEPDLCFVLTGDGKPLGYIIGARDSVGFSQRTAAEWFPALRERYPFPPEDDTSDEAGMIRALHRGYYPPPEADDYPAHLHIDILPGGRHGGNGSKLMAVFLNRLRELGVPGVHLGVGGGNARAIAFYERMGFQRVREEAWGIIFGMKLNE